MSGQEISAQMENSRNWLKIKEPHFLKTVARTSDWAFDRLVPDNVVMLPTLKQHSSVVAGDFFYSNFSK